VRFGARVNYFTPIINKTDQATDIYFNQDILNCDRKVVNVFSDPFVQNLAQTGQPEAEFRNVQFR
jgi:hypothetical protein